MVTVLSVIGSLLTLAILILQMVNDQKVQKKAREDAIDKEIDKAANAADILHIAGELRNKK